MSRRAVAGVLLLALILSVAFTLLGSEPAQGTVPSETVLDRFPIAKNVGALLVPVEIKGRYYMFALDTGASFTVYDTALRHLLGKMVGREEARTASGAVMVFHFFQPPVAKLGNLPLPQDSPVAIADLEKFRQRGYGEEYGIIGMDFLRKHIIRIDFDRSEVVFLRSIGPKPGKRLPLSFRRGCPHVPIRIAGHDDTEFFMLDIGFVGQCSGEMRAELFDELIRKKRISSLMRTQVTDWSHTNLEVQEGQIESISLADHPHEGLFFLRFEHNLLSLSFCSRYVMTFDFPNGSLYLKQGAADRFARQMTID